MKTRISQYLIAVLLCTSAAFTVAGDFQSTSSFPLQINVPNDRFLVIHNFTQEGQAATTRGTVIVTIGNQTPVNVLSAAIIDPTTTSMPLEVINRVVIAGPAMVTVTCGTGATDCFVSYRKDSD